jgi:hypothetical protein
MREAVLLWVRDVLRGRDLRYRGRVQPQSFRVSSLFALFALFVCLFVHMQYIPQLTHHLTTHYRLPIAPSRGEDRARFALLVTANIGITFLYLASSSQPKTTSRKKRKSQKRRRIKLLLGFMTILLGITIWSFFEFFKAFAMMLGFFVVMAVMVMRRSCCCGAEETPEGPEDEGYSY